MKKEAHRHLINKVLQRWHSQLETARRTYRFRDDVRIDRTGDTLDYAEWHVLTLDKEYFTVAEDVFDEIRLVTIWIGRNESPFVVFVFVGEDLRALSICDNESEAEWLHARLIFMIEQKIWSFDD